jgi:hypothetical protein
MTGAYFVFPFTLDFYFRRTARPYQLAARRNNEMDVNLPVGGSFSAGKAKRHSFDSSIRLLFASPTPELFFLSLPIYLLGSGG